VLYKFKTYSLTYLLLSVWNSLPDSLRNPVINGNSFRQSLKTFLFATYWCIQHIRGFTTMRYINRVFTYLLIYLLAYLLTYYIRNNSEKHESGGRVLQLAGLYNTHATDKLYARYQHKFLELSQLDVSQNSKPGINLKLYSTVSCMAGDHHMCYELWCESQAFIAGAIFLFFICDLDLCPENWTALFFYIECIRLFFFSEMFNDFHYYDVCRSLFVKTGA